MGGRSLRRAQMKDFKDPFNAGQMVGMLVAFTFIEKNGRVPKDFVKDIQWVAAENLQTYFQKPTEDIFLMIDELVKEMGTL